MEQYIRDKYERKLFMSPDARGSMPVTAAARGNISHSSSSSGTNIGRYPLQMKSLREMGFTDVNANAEAVNASKGNLQEAIEALLASKTSKISIGEERRESMKRESSPTEDLVSIFGVPAISSSTTHKSSITTNSENNSILDLDLPPPTTERKNSGVTLDEFEEFEAAAVPASRYQRKAESSSNGHRPSVVDESTMTATTTAEIVTKAPSTTKSSLPPAMGNPWASNNSGNGDAFDDIDPFRGFTPNHRG
jgi:hypothetical protein